MHSTTTLLTLAAAPLALAAPAALKRQDATGSGPVGLIAAHSTSPIHLQPINAADTSFYIGKPTVSYCPTAQVSSCPVGNVTAIDVGTGDGRAGMDVEVPGGQDIYVLPTGALAFTPAHAEGTSTTKNGTTTGFTYVNGTEAGELGRFDFKGLGSQGWLACPVTAKAAEHGPWQVYADIIGISNNDVPGKNVSACIGFDALGSPFTGAGADGAAAWQYE